MNRHDICCLTLKIESVYALYDIMSKGPVVHTSNPSLREPRGTMDACLPCFGSRRRDEDREPLLPSHHQVQRPAPTSHQPPSPDEPLNKLVDVLAALSAGKLPSQAQINTFLRRVLNSNILQESQYTQGRTTPHILHGNGPLSKRGRKVIQDLVEFIEAFLQFGMEKNGMFLLVIRETRR